MQAASIIHLTSTIYNLLNYDLMLFFKFYHILYYLLIDQCKYSLIRLLDRHFTKLALKFKIS